MIEIEWKDIFDVSDVLNPDWTRWREFLSSFLHFIKFGEDTFKSEQELREIEEQEQEARFIFDKTSANLNNLLDSNEEFELDEKEIVLSEEIPNLKIEYEKLSFDKREQEEILAKIEDTLSRLYQESSTLKREMDQWKVQIVRSPEKIKQTQEQVKFEWEAVSKKNQELK